jgi:hypothetical protein
MDFDCAGLCPAQSSARRADARAGQGAVQRAASAFDAGARYLAIDLNHKGIRRPHALMAEVGSVEACSLTAAPPDGKKIAFTMFVAQAGQSDLYTVNPDGSDPHQVTYSGLRAGLKDWGTHPLTH